MEAFYLSAEYSLSMTNKPKDWSNLPGIAKKHVPVIDSPTKVKANEAFPVKLKVGGIDGIEHPNQLAHWINWVELYAGERLIYRTELAPEVTDGYVITVHVALAESTELRAKASCNVHGVWEGEPKNLTVE